ncbi:hypothetical protein IV203_017910 [Nitzschia inconspicua]|uniref:Uncharacterized protein n=1 Tax=Nitzschia inconspicua TaxID=303405 RepID=A0A9K3M038_9STRA|nr:hypothetical protein IV203_017910 [Nitzschia inconspicua]
MTRVRADQRELIDSFIDKVKEGLEQFEVNGAQLTEHRLRQVLEHFEERIRTIEFRGGQGNEAAEPERVETGACYTLHMYGGCFFIVFWLIGAFRGVEFKTRRPYAICGFI